MRRIKSSLRNSSHFVFPTVILASSTYEEYKIEKGEEDLGEARSAVGHHGEQDGLQQPETKGRRE